jgi:aryl-alcohol dehydrogenase-like predicted oxidoreductase
METRTLPHTDLTVSRACFGTMTFGGQTDPAAAERMVDLCIDRGVNFFDTANVYTGGQSETILGGILKCGGRRQRVVVASKVGVKLGDAAGKPSLTRQAIFENLEGSLRRLQTDYLDLYYLHMPDGLTPIEETLEAMDQVVRSGKARHLGLSNYASWQACEMQWICEKHGWRAPFVSQPMYNLLARAIEQEYLAFCRRFGVSTVVYNPLAGGLLTGKQQQARPLPGTRFDNNQMYLDRYWHPAYFDAVEELGKAAAATGRSMIDLSLNWLLFHTTADCVILGASKIEQLEETLDVFGRAALEAETLAAVDRVWQDLRGVTPRYNRDT